MQIAKSGDTNSKKHLNFMPPSAICQALVASNSDGPKFNVTMTPFRRLTVSLLFLTILNCNAVFAQTKDLTPQESKFINLYSKLTSFIQEDYDSLSF